MLAIFVPETSTQRLYSGLYSFGATCTVISLYNCRASGVVVPNVVVGMALAIGGLGELVAGIFEFIRGSTYTGTRA